MHELRLNQQQQLRLNTQRVGDNIKTKYVKEGSTGTGVPHFFNSGVVSTTAELFISYLAA
jgi:hypothetical protein